MGLLRAIEILRGSSAVACDINPTHTEQIMRLPAMTDRSFAPVFGLRENLSLGLTLLVLLTTGASG
jgi:hypothetical protein